MPIRYPMARWTEWLFAALLMFVVSSSAGCSKSDTGAKADGAAAAAPAAPAPAPAAAPAPAPVPEANKERKANRKLAEALEKAKNEKKVEKAKPDAAPNKFSSEDPSKWNAGDLKLAVARKDPRFTPAVTMRGASSRGDANAGTELSDVLAAVTKMPADGSGGLNAVNKAPVRKRKKSSKRGDDDEPSATAATPAVPSAVPPGTGPPPGPLKGPAADGKLPEGFKLKIKRRD